MMSRRQLFGGVGEEVPSALPRGRAGRVNPARRRPPARRNSRRVKPSHKREPESHKRSIGDFSNIQPRMDLLKLLAPPLYLPPASGRDTEGGREDYALMDC